MDRHDRLHEASAAARHSATTSTTTTSAPTAQYGARVPSQNTLYDWSPLPSMGLDEHDADSDERSLRALQSRLGLTPNPTTAALQAMRRHSRFSARTRDHLQRYNHERDNPLDRYQARRSQQPQPQPQPQSQPQPQLQPQPPTVAPILEHTVEYLSRIRHANSVDESLDCALEAGFLSKHYFCVHNPDFLTDAVGIPPPQETSWLAPGAVLSGCQHATTSTPTPDLAMGQLPPPSRPWLSTSYATPRSLTPHLSPNAPRRADPQQPAPHQDRWPVKVTIHAVDWSEMSLSATMEAYNVPSHPRQHSLNNPPYIRTSSITTYLEGEILDFNTHTLLTESFKSNAANDALYWRKLPPFKDMQDEDVVRGLTSRKWWENLNKEWVLMRWKERCFVKSLRPSSKLSSQPPPPGPPIDGFVGANTTPSTDPVPQEPDSEREYSELHELGPQWDNAEHAAFDDSSCGLTISGFYYVCLRRSDGRVEGLYYDPMSSPYQCLMLESQARGRFGSWAFA